MQHVSAPASERRHVLVTGGASGLGRAVVEQLVREGALVAALDLHPSDADLSFEVDVSRSEDVRTAITATVERFGRLDGVAHCAGVFDNTFDPVHELTDAAWEKTIGVNLKGAFNVARSSLPHLMSSGGSIVFVGSVAARHPQPGGALYSASKAGVGALARSIALEYAPHGVSANTVLPGYMDSAMTAFLHDRPELRDRIVEGIPMGRIADPSEVAVVVCMLLSNAARYLTGDEIVVDGGTGLTSFVGNNDVDAMWDRYHKRRDASALH